MPAETNTPEAPIQVVRLAFSSFDQLDEVISGWDLDWRQLDQGALDASLLQVASRHATISRFTFSRRFLQRGSSPPEMLTFGLIGEAVGEIDWCRKKASTENLLVFSQGGGYESVSRPGFCGDTLSYSEEYLEQTAADFELPFNLGPYREGGIALHLDPAAAEDLRRRFRHLEHAVTTCSGDDWRRWVRHEVEHEIPVRLLRLLAADPPKTTMRIGGFKARAARIARDYIDAHAADAPAIQDVVRAAGVSWRSLDYAFREVFGVTPKQYLQATRLHGARKELCQGDPGSTVTDIANRWGFWHIGKFAADYRRQFCELPSETARRLDPNSS